MIGTGIARTSSLGVVPITYSAQSVDLVATDVVELFIAPENNGDTIRFENVTLLIRTAVSG